MPRSFRDGWEQTVRHRPQPYRAGWLAWERGERCAPPFLPGSEEHQLWESGWAAAYTLDAYLRDED